MSTFREALSAWLAVDGNTQVKLAEGIGKSQVAVHRYCEGDRFPDADTARAIDRETSGEVSFAVWQAEFLSRSGLAA